MIALLVLVQKFTLDSPFCSLLKEIQESAEYPEDIEIIAKFSTPEEQRDFRSYIQNTTFTFRAIGISVIRHMEYVDQHADYNECYLQALPTGQLVLPLLDNATGFIKGWDTQLLIQYEKYKKQFGHSIFTLNAAQLSNSPTIDLALNEPANSIAFTREWLGIVGGFGIIPEINAWARGIHYYLRTVFEIDVSVKLESLLFKMPGHQEETSRLLSAQFTTIMLQEAKSIYLSIKSKNREKIISHSMRNFNAIGAMYELAEKAPIQKIYQHAFWRYVAETNPFIMSMHSLPLMDVMSSAALHKKKQLNLWMTPLSWLPYLSKWKMDDMRALPVSPPPVSTDSKNIYYEMLKNDFNRLLRKLKSK